MSNRASNVWIGDEYSQLLVNQIAVMVEKEGTFYSRVDYLKDLPASNDLIDEGWRQKAAEWMFKVIDFYVRESKPSILSQWRMGIATTHLLLLLDSRVRIWIETS